VLCLFPAEYFHIQSLLCTYAYTKSTCSKLYLDVQILLCCIGTRDINYSVLLWSGICACEPPQWPKSHLLTVKKLIRFSVSAIMVCTQIMIQATIICTSVHCHQPWKASVFFPNALWTLPFSGGSLVPKPGWVVSVLHWAGVDHFWHIFCYCLAPNAVWVPKSPNSSMLSGALACWWLNSLGNCSRAGPNTAKC
jgi:hypothetical protein